MRVRRYRQQELSSDVTDRLIQNSFYGSRGFSDLWRSVGGEPVYWVVEEGDRLLALLTGVEFGSGPTCRFQSMPDGCYSPFFVDPESTVDQTVLASAILEGLQKQKYARLHIFDFHGWCPKQTPFDTGEKTTYLVDVSDPDWVVPDRRLRAQIRKAEREGLNVEVFNSEDKMDMFLDMMHRTEERHDRAPKYSEAFFRALAELTESDPRALWYWVEHKGEAVASYIRFIEGNIIVNWQLYCDKKFTSLRANQYVFDYVVRQLRGQGMRFVDQGASPPGAESLIYYKKRWGGEPRAYSTFSAESWVGKIVSTAKKAKGRIST